MLRFSIASVSQTPIVYFLTYYISSKKKIKPLEYFTRIKRVPYKHCIVQSLSHVRLCHPHGLQHTRLPCPSLSPRVCSNSCPLSHWCHPTISSSVAPFSCPQSFPASGSVPMSQLFTSGGQSIGTSASAPVLPMNIQEREHKLSQKRTTWRFSFLFKILPN